LSINVPADFPASQFEAVVHNNKLTAHAAHNEYPLLSDALRAIPYRFRTLTEYDHSFTALIKDYGIDAFRYEQGRDLFGFFSNGYSVFEAFCFALFAIGALTGSPEFPLANDQDERKVGWTKMEGAYRTAFPRDPILDELERIAKDPAFVDLGVIRNFLTHRAVPARAVGASMGPSAKPDKTTIPRLKITVDAGTTSSRRLQVARLLLLGLDAMHKFIEAQL
jgi:hypothetical protein